MQSISTNTSTYPETLSFYLKVFFVFFIGIVVAGCSGDDAPESTQLTSPSGIWNGTMRSKVTGEFQAVRAYIAINSNSEEESTHSKLSESLTTQILGLPTFHLLGATDYSEQSKSFTISAIYYGNSGEPFGGLSLGDTLVFNGTFESEFVMSGTYTSASDNGELSLSFQNETLKPILVEQFVGQWSMLGGSTEVEIAVDSDYSVEITDAGLANCSIAGDIDLGDVTLDDTNVATTDYNLFATTLTLSNCEIDDGSYSGFMWIQDFATSGDDRKMRFSVNNSSYSLEFSLVKQSE